MKFIDFHSADSVFLLLSLSCCELYAFPIAFWAFENPNFAEKFPSFDNRWEFEESSGNWKTLIQLEAFRIYFPAIFPMKIWKINDSTVKSSGKSIMASCASVTNSHKFSMFHCILSASAKNICSLPLHGTYLKVMTTKTVP